MIHLVITDDWELRGDGSGDVERLQFRPMQQLISIFTRYGVRASFYVEIMQQLSFRRFQDQHAELKPLADRWDEAVVATYREGHDIQLHVHPHWMNARYERGGWKLGERYSLLDYSPRDIRGMLNAGKVYLESLLQGINPQYRCIAFRAGAFSIAPSPFILPLLAEFGLRLDTSMVGGLCVGKVDYTAVDEEFLPYYPLMNDARRLSSHPEPIVCVPVHNLKGHRLQFLRRDSKLFWKRVRQKLLPNGHFPEPAYKGWSRLVEPRFPRMRRILQRYIWGETHISDLAHLDYPLMQSVLLDIRSRVKRSGLGNVPVVLACHSKEIRDFADIERFVADVSRAQDVCCITLSELAQLVTSGRFAIRYRESAAGASTSN